MGRGRGGGGDVGSTSAEKTRGSPPRDRSHVGYSQMAVPAADTCQKILPIVAVSLKL